MKNSRKDLLKLVGKSNLAKEIVALSFKEILDRLWMCDIGSFGEWITDYLFFLFLNS